MRRAVPMSLVISLALAACTPSAEESTTSSLPPETGTAGVITIDDPGGLIMSAVWLDAPTPALDRPIPDDEPPAVLMSSSQSTSLHIAVNGNGCLPQIDLAVAEPEPLTLVVLIRPGIPANDIQCPALLTTHGFAVGLSAPLDVDATTLTVTSIPPG